MHPADLQLCWYLQKNVLKNDTRELVFIMILFYILIT